MLQAYSENVEVAALSPVPFNSGAVKKGCTADISGATIELNRRGVYMVSVDGTAAASTTIQLNRDGVALPQAQSTGTNVSFVTLIQVNRDNTCNCCSSPVSLQVISETATTFTNINVCVTKIC